MRPLLILTIAVVLAGCTLPPRPSIITSDDGWPVHSLVYGRGDRGIVLVHGGKLTKESWDPQARQMVNAGFRVIAIDLRGFGESKLELPAASKDAKQLDVLAAIRYLRNHGAKSVSLVGGSMGGDAVAQAAVDCNNGDIDRIVMIASGGIDHPEMIKGRKLFIVSRDDLGPDGKPRLEKIRIQYQRAAEPKKLIILDGNAHAQFIFATDQGPRLMHEILSFLTQP